MKKLNTHKRSLGILVSLMMYLVSLAQAQVVTHFIDQSGTFSSNGDYWYQEFTLSKPTVLVLRFTSDYQADAAIFTASELNNFANSRAFSGFALFDDSFGTTSESLPAGTYYLGIRNQTGGTNAYRAELDYDIEVPQDQSFSYTFVDQYMQGTDYVAANGGKLWHEFTIQEGYRYFLDGCNTGLSTYVIPASELNAFRFGSSFNYYTDYSGTDMANPGLDEIELNPGVYYLAFDNATSISKPVTYTMERWKRSAIVGGSLEMANTASWRTFGTTVRIKVAKVSNRNPSATTGQLRLRLWAARSKFAGGGLTGYVIGVKNLAALAPNTEYSAISSVVRYRKPPTGRYYTVITLEERTASGWKIRDYINFSSRTAF